MYLLAWNVDQLGASKRINAVASAIASTEPDIVTLQEVRSKNKENVADALEERGLPHVWHSHEPRPCSDREVEKGYHCVIASRWPLTDPPGGDAWRCSAPFPEVLGRVTVKAPEGEVDVISGRRARPSRRWRWPSAARVTRLACSPGISMNRGGFCVRASF